MSQRLPDEPEHGDGLDSIRKVIEPPVTKLHQGIRLKDRYEIIKKLGSGGMGRIYQAKDLELHRDVAIKQIISMPGMEDSETLERLKREYYFLSTINHPNLVQAYDFFQEKNESFLVLEFVIGISLKDFLDDGQKKLSFVEQLAIANQICRSVEILNTAGILHRDIKPANIMLDKKKGRIKLLDLGLGKSLKKDLATITQLGSIVGTPEYLSPEQANGKLSQKSDIFSLGITLYQFFLWEKASPFKTHSSVTTMMNVLSKDLPPLASRIEVLGLTIQEKTAYQAVSDILEKALAKNPEDRLENAGILADRIHEVHQTLVSQSEKNKISDAGLWDVTASLSPEDVKNLRQVSEKYGVEKCEVERLSEEKRTEHKEYKKVTRIRKRREEIIQNQSSITFIAAGIVLILIVIGFFCLYETNRQKALKLIFTGEMNYKHKEYAQAKENFTKAIELDPYIAYAYYQRGLVYTQQKKYDEAENDFTRAIQLQSNYAEAYSSRSLIYFLQGDYEKSDADYAKAMEFNRNISHEYAEKIEKLTYSLPKDVWKNSSYQHQGEWILDMSTAYWEKLSVDEQQAYSRGYQEAYAKVKGYQIEKEITYNKCVFVMRLIPPGRFWMGSSSQEKLSIDNEKRHKVILSKPFYISKYEITQSQWKAAMGTSPSYFKGDTLPVDYVNWYDCQEFCKKLGFALPTEAQWEYACRGGTLSAFPWGEQWNKNKANCASYWAKQDLSDSVDYKNFGFFYKSQTLGAKTISVGGFTSNSYGLYDMLGNLWEWCQDNYGEYNTLEEIDPIGPRLGKIRVVRSGSFMDPNCFIRSAARGYFYPNYYSNTVGVRPVVDVETASK